MIVWVSVFLLSCSIPSLGSRKRFRTWITLNSKKKKINIHNKRIGS